MNDKRLPVPHGAPLRMRVERQLGYKQAKYVMRIEVVDYLEGRLTEENLTLYRQGFTAPAHVYSQGARGLCSYPHPYLMPDCWQFPTGSMGIGPISSIYHARFMGFVALTIKMRNQIC